MDEKKEDSTKPLAPKKSISNKEYESLKKLAEMSKETEITPEEATVLEIITKRKFVDQIRREVNLARRPFGKELLDQETIENILKSLETKKLAKKLEVPNGFVWVSIEHIRYKALGSDRL